MGLDAIAARLEGLEEAILHRLLDRAQFSHNPGAYVARGSGIAGEEQRSLLQLRLRYQEEMDAVFGRFGVPEEQPWHTDLPVPRREAQLSRDNAGFSRAQLSVNLSRQVLDGYLGFLPRICAAGDDGHHGSAVELDVAAFQAISRRVHYGALYVARVKYQADPGAYDALITASDEAGLLARLSRPEVEARIAQRVADKAEALQARVNPLVRRRVDPVPLVQMFQELVIPLTKAGEVAVLLAQSS